MDNIPTKEELDAKLDEVHALWTEANRAMKKAAALEEEFKDMRHRFYSSKLDGYE